jgi:hypothetical protein
MFSRKLLLIIVLSPMLVTAQVEQEIKLVKVERENRIDIYAGSLFTRFYIRTVSAVISINDAANTTVTRGLMRPRPDEPTIILSPGFMACRKCKC